MRPLLALVGVIGLAAIVADAQTPTESQRSPREAVERFCKMESEGRWLGPERWDELQDFLGDVGSWSRPDSISVLRSYKVGDARKDIGAGGSVSYQVEVDYFQWGSIDRFLNFTSARGPRRESPPAGQPVELRTYETVYLSDRFVRRRASGDKEETGALGWRIALFGPPSVSVDAALRWVAEMRDKSDDPAIKHNAGRTLAILRSLSAGGLMPAAPARRAKETPSVIAHRFVGLESVLLPDEWSKVADFFVSTPKPQWDKVHIVDIVGTGVDINGDSAEVDVSTNLLGDLDASLLLSNYPPGRLSPGGPSACYGDDRYGFSLLLSDNQWEVAKDGVVKQSEVPLAWRIEDTSFEPLITLDTAIRYVRQARERSADPAVNRNAAKTLGILGYYQERKPLPDELLSANGGCR